MATLTDPISTQNIVDRFADYVTATANSGISWGTNAYPFTECDFGASFGGTTAGKTISITGANITPNASSEIAAQNIYDTLITEVATYTRIRNIRCQLNVTGGGGNNGSRPTAGVIYDSTAVANMTTAYLQTGITAARDDVYANNAITSGGLEVMFSNMRSAYNTARSTTVASIFVTNVCHASCHSSCHSSRGRR